MGKNANYSLTAALDHGLDRMPVKVSYTVHREDRIGSLLVKGSA